MRHSNRDFKGPPPWAGRTHWSRGEWQPGRRLFRIVLFVTIGFFVVPVLASAALTATFSGWTSVAVAVVFWAAFLLIGALLLRFVFQNLRIVRDLISITGRLADGDYSARVQGHGSPAARPMVDSFNRMAERLEVSDELRRRLLADVGHELRTPLTVVRGELEAMADGVRDLSPDQIRLLLNDIAVMERLLDDLRTLSTTEAGMVALDTESTDLSELASEVVERFGPQASESGIELILSAPRPVIALIDPYRIGQVLANLMVNALRATGENGTVAVAVTSSVVDDRSVAVATVTDTGRGIPPDEIDAVFDRFHKGDDSSGSGLGLTISRDLVHGHGGTITLSSDVDVGTTVTVTLPSGE